MKNFTIVLSFQNSGQMAIRAHGLRMSARCSRSRLSISCKALLAALVGFVSLIALSLNAHALTFSKHKNSTSRLTAILAEGPIVVGDTDKLNRFLSANKMSTNRVVYLASQGGNSYEAIQLGYYLREHRIKTAVEGGRQCLSSCAVAFMAGTERSGRAWRSVSSDSQLGFHSASNMESSRDGQTTLRDIMHYYSKVMSIPDALVDKWFRTPFDRMYILPKDEVCRFGIKFWDADQRKFLC